MLGGGDINDVDHIGAYHIYNRNFNSTVGCSGSSIRAAYNTQSGMHCVSKRIVKWRLSQIGWDNLERGIKVHKYLNSFDYDGFVKLFDVLDDEENKYLFMESMDGDLISLLERRRVLEIDEVRSIFKKIVEIVDFMHSKGVAHRDLKPDNVLFNWDPLLTDKVSCIKLTDFGFSSFIEKDRMFTTPCGSPSYLAPEICQPNPCYRGDASDIWSLGVTLYVLLCGRFPWNSDTQNILELFELIMYDPLRVPAHLPPEVHDLLNKMLTKDPSSMFLRYDMVGLMTSLISRINLPCVLTNL
eukprot:TRINITY_DN2759_c0_g1_i1.p1 TRINITY_DN2759_c0_g1~~TRINITY_DN2759_c0_g1_i1.p1  ORF type:complete len:298 (+),score=21.48 TRINITY_DN2759_c0_g1_i1:140-1033(+)